MHLVGYLYEDYHDARSLEHKVITVNLANKAKTTVSARSTAIKYKKLILLGFGTPTIILKCFLK